MTLREALGGDARRIHELVDALLDREDAILALFDGRRVVSFGHGFGISASQMEFLSLELERALRSVVGAEPVDRADRDTGRERNQRRRGPVRGDGNRRHTADGVLRLASQVA